MFPFHVEVAKKVGASRAEVISAILIGLPAADHTVTRVLSAAVSADARIRASVNEHDSVKEEVNERQTGY